MIKLMTIVLMFSLNSYAKSVDVEITKRNSSLKEHKLIYKNKIKKMPVQTEVHLSFDQIENFNCFMTDLGKDSPDIYLGCIHSFTSGDVRKKIVTTFPVFCNNSDQVLAFIDFKEFENGAGQTLSSHNSYYLKIKCKGK